MTGYETLDPIRLKRVTAAVESDIEAGRYDGAAYRIGLGGHTIAMGAVGFSDPLDKLTMTQDAVFALLSGTKVITALAVLRAVDRGDIMLTSRISEIIPEFGQHGKQTTTILQMLVHMGAMPYGTPDGMSLSDFQNLKIAVAAICKLQPETPSGVQVTYSARAGYTILGEVVRRLDSTGRSFRDIVKDDIFLPLNMHDSAIGLSPELAKRRVRVYLKAPPEAQNAFYRELNSYDQLFAAPSEYPSGGGFSTLGDLTKLVDCLANHGTSPETGYSLLSPALLRLATTIQTGDLPNLAWTSQLESSVVSFIPANLGLGFFIRGNGLHVHAFGLTASPSTFGGLGAGSVMMWIEPLTGLSFTFLSAGLLQRLDAHQRNQRLSDLVHAVLTAS